TSKSACSDRKTRGHASGLKGTASQARKKSVLRISASLYNLRKNSDQSWFGKGTSLLVPLSRWKCVCASAPEVCFLRRDEFFRKLFSDAVSSLSSAPLLGVTAPEGRPNLAQRFTTCGKTPTRTGFGKGTTSQLADKVGVALDFGWRSGSPLRLIACFQCRLL